MSCFFTSTVSVVGYLFPLQVPATGASRVGASGEGEGSVVPRGEAVDVEEPWTSEAAARTGGRTAGDGNERWGVFQAMSDRTVVAVNMGTDSDWMEA